MTGNESRAEAAELLAIYQGMVRADQVALLRFARMRREKFKAAGAGLFPPPRDSSPAALFDSVGREI